MRVEINPSADRICAMIGYWLTQGRTQDQALTRFRLKFPDSPETLFWEAITLASRGAACAARYRNLDESRKLGEIRRGGD